MTPAPAAAVVVLVLAAPFDSPGTVVLDVIRVVLAAVGFTLAGAFAWAAWDRDRLRTPARRMSAAGAGVALFVLAASRIEALGRPITWQMVLAAVAFALFAASFETYRAEDRRGRRRRTGESTGRDGVREGATWSDTR